MLGQQMPLQVMGMPMLSAAGHSTGAQSNSQAVQAQLGAQFALQQQQQFAMFQRMQQQQNLQAQRVMQQFQMQQHALAGSRAASPGGASAAEALQAEQPSAGTDPVAAAAAAHDSATAVASEPGPSGGDVQASS